MRRLLRALLKLVLNAALLAALGAAVRYVIGRVSGEPGVAGGQRGPASFDAWPPVPQAPERHRS
ncbi:MAG: hypothetical protein ACYDA2_06225 [Acidimicrobiales bacterium]